MPNDLTTDLAYFLQQLYAGSGSFTAASFTATATSALTASAPGLTITQTWNNAGVTFTAALVNVTDTASAATSKLADFQVASSTKVSILKSGRIVTDSTYQTGGISGSDAPTGGVAIVFRSGGIEFMNSGNVRATYMGSSSFAFSSAYTLGWVSGADAAGTVDVSLLRDAADTLAQRRSTNPQATHHYGRYVSSSDRTYLAIRHATTTLASVSGATVTATNLIPAGAIVLGISTQVTVALGTGNGTTGYQVGDGSDPDRWGNVTGTATTTKTKNSDWTAATVPIFTAAQNVVITANGGNFNGTGSIWIDVAYAFGDAN